MASELVLNDDGSLMQEPGDIIPADDTSINVLRLNHHDRGSSFRDMLAAAVQMFNAADIIGKIQKGTEFVVQVPAQYQPELEAGAVQMMHGGKSGKTRATLVRKLADGKQEIVCNCPIKEEIRIQGTPIQNLTGIYQNLYFQQKLSELSAQVQEVYNAVLRIEQGQMDDRIGKLKVFNLRDYFQVTRLGILEQLKISGIAYHRTYVKEKYDYALAAWAQRARIVAQSCIVANITVWVNPKIRVNNNEVG